MCTIPFYFYIRWRSSTTVIWKLLSKRSRQRRRKQVRRNIRVMLVQRRFQGLVKRWPKRELLGSMYWLEDNNDDQTTLVCSGSLTYSYKNWPINFCRVDINLFPLSYVSCHQYSVLKYLIQECFQLKNVLL